MKTKKTKNVFPNVEVTISPDYLNTLADLKRQIQQAQLKAIVTVNRELVLLYWNIGKTIAEKIEKNGWGSKTVEKMSKDLIAAFPNMEGFSSRNLRFMIQFFSTYPNIEIVKQLVSQIPWGHNILLLQKLKTEKERLWYAQKTVEHGWSRSVLLVRIENDLYKREGKAISNFKSTIPAPHSDLAQQMTKDPYIFDYLTPADDQREQELEQGLIDHIQKTLIELGQGFSFVGRQFHLEVGEVDFWIDLLFYHLKLRCYVIVELKAKAFDPRDAGQMNFYLSAVDDLLRHPDDKPTIGMLLCQTKNNLVVEYALRNLNSPIGVSSYATQWVESLPKELKGSLPTIAEIEAELEKTKKCY